MDGRPTWTDCDEAGDYVVPNVLSPRDLVSRHDIMDETVPHTKDMFSLTDKDAILKRWAEHFNSVLNRPSSVNDNAINRLPQIECNVLLDEFPTVTETRKAIQHLSPGKAPGTDAIPAEVYKAGGLPMAEKLTELFQCM